jgi:hypothetical protein
MLVSACAALTIESEAGASVDTAKKIPLADAAPKTNFLNIMLLIHSIVR